MPPATIIYDGIVAAAERVALAYTGTYVHPKYQKEVRYTGMLSAEVRDGKLTAGGWGELDRLGRQQPLEQIGATVG